MSRLALALSFTLLSAATAFGQLPDNWYNRPQVIQTANRLAEEVELLDEALHDINAPHHFIDKVHHFEETVLEFVDMVRTGCTYYEARQEFNHIRQDVQMIRAEFNAHPNLLYNYKVATEWRHVRTAYRYLDHQMFIHVAGRLSPEAVATLEKDMAELEAAH